MTRVLAVLAVGGLAAHAVAAREILVADAGEFNRAVRTLQPGDTLVLRDGVWRDAKLAFTANGTPTQPVTLQAQTPGKVRLTGASSVRLAGEFLVVRGLWFTDGALPDGHVLAFRTASDKTASHSRVTECAIVDYNSGNRAGSSYWVSLYGVSNRVDHCRFEGKDDGSPVLTVWLEGRPTGHRIDHNHFLRRPPLGRNGGETIRIGDSKTSMQNAHTLVEFNRFEDCSGEAEIISNKSCENVYRQNVFVECQGALVLRQGNRGTVEGNWFFGNHRPGTGGVRVIGEDHRVVNNYFEGLAGEDFESALPVVDGIPDSPLNGYCQVQRALVAFNTWVLCRQNLTFGIGHGRRGRSLPARDCVFAHNVVWGTNPPLVRVVNPPVNLRWRGNLFWGATVDLPATPGIRVADPRLVRGHNGVWRPDADSPARGAGADEFPFVTHDIEGRPRIGRKDAGAFQVAAGAEATAPGFSRPAVGPGWWEKIEKNDLPYGARGINKY